MPCDKYIKRLERDYGVLDTVIMKKSTCKFDILRSRAKKTCHIVCKDPQVYT